MLTAASTMESTIVFRRPNVSANCPPMKAAPNRPTPYAPSASPASRVVKPWRVRYSVRNGTTNVPNLFRKTPANRIQTGRGNDRRVVQRDSFGGGGAERVSINKKPCRPFGGQGGKFSVWFPRLFPPAQSK